MSLLIVSSKTMGYQSANMLEESCKRYGIPLEFYGGGFKGFRMMKCIELPNYLRNSSAEYVMYTDSTDSWLLRPDIFQVYLDNFKDKVIVSGNRDHYPNTNLYTEFPEAPTSMRYICCSQFIGPREKVIQTLDTINNKWTIGDTDQEGWHYCHVNKFIDIEIDHYCKLFLNMTNVQLEEISSDFKFLETNFYPSSIHYGGGKAIGSFNYENMKSTYERWFRGY